MSTIVLNDHEEWPSLGSASKNTSAAVASPAAPEETPENDWELLATPEHESSSEKEKVVVVIGNPKSFRHSASSPDLRCFQHLCILEGEEEGGEDSDQAEESKSLTKGEDIEDSYSMMSTPASVWSMSSGLSFRDAILTSKTVPVGAPLEKSAASPKHVQPRHKQRIKPRFVVKPIKRCIKSTGDLQSLAVCPEEEEEEILGATDAMEFYHRKEAGYQGRVNGSKIRPDEAKRREITMYKKNLQRQANAIRSV